MEEYQSLGGSSLPTRTRGLGETSMRRGAVYLGLAYPSAGREAPEDPGCEGTAKHLWSIT